MSLQLSTSPLAKNNFIPKYLYMTYIEEVPMGNVFADVELINGDDLALVRRHYMQEQDVRRVEVRVLVDSGATTLCINEALRDQLGLVKVSERTVELADGSLRSLDVVGPVELRYENRFSTLNAMVLPGASEVLLGAIPLEDMDLLIDTRNQRLIVNPASPYVPRAKAKSPRPPRV